MQLSNMTLKIDVINIITEDNTRKDKENNNKLSKHKIKTEQY